MQILFDYFEFETLFSYLYKVIFPKVLKTISRKHIINHILLYNYLLHKQPKYKFYRGKILASVFIHCLRSLFYCGKITLMFIYHNIGIRFIPNLGRSAQRERKYKKCTFGGLLSKYKTFGDWPNMLLNNFLD